MFLRLKAILLILISQHVMAVEFPIQITEYLDDKRIIVSINESDIDETLSWKPESGSPPLTMAGAIGAVRKQIASDVTEPVAEFLEIELKQIPHHPQQWHYLVKMINRHGGEQIPSYFVVLMNAKVVPALPRPEPLR